MNAVLLIYDTVTGCMVLIDIGSQVTAILSYRTLQINCLWTFCAFYRVILKSFFRSTSGIVTCLHDGLAIRC